VSGGDAVARFLGAAGWGTATREALAGDASGRRYWRLRRRAESVVLMQAPADAALDAFVNVGALLAGLGLSTPAVLADGRGEGLLLLEDFGDELFSRRLDRGLPPAPLLDLAVDALCHLHRHFDVASAPAALPRYDTGVFLDQVMLFAEAALPGVVADAALAEAAAEFRAAWSLSLATVADAPASLLLRDYHAGNLVLLPDRPGIAACGLLDFQDAGVGSRAYDLVSLIEDARRDYPEALRASAGERYLAAFPELDRRDFLGAAAVLGTMRHFRVLGIFERLARQCGRAEYLVHRPRLWQLIGSHLAEPALAPVADWLARWLPLPRDS
jgi:hypothetical protein